MPMQISRFYFRFTWKQYQPDEIGSVVKGFLCVLKWLAAFLVRYILAALVAGAVFSAVMLTMMNHPGDTNFTRRIIGFLFMSVSIAKFIAAFALLPSIVAAVILWRVKATSAVAYMTTGFVISIVTSLALVERGVGAVEMWPIYPAAVVAGLTFWKVSRALGLRFEGSA